MAHTEVKTGGARDSRWFSGSLRFTLTKQERLTRLVKAIIEKNRNHDLQ